MPNWLEGQIKFKGTRENIKKFIETELIDVNFVAYEDNTHTQEFVNNLILDKDDSVQGKVNGTWFRTFIRAYISGLYTDFLYKYNEEEVIFIANVKSAWNLTKEEIIKLATTYNIDVRGYMVEQGMCFDLNFNVEKDGKVKTYCHGKYKHFEWNCMAPLLGG